MLHMSRYPEQSEMRKVHTCVVYIAGRSYNSMALLAGCDNNDSQQIRSCSVRIAVALSRLALPLLLLGLLGRLLLLLLALALGLLLGRLVLIVLALLGLLRGLSLLTSRGNGRGSEDISGRSGLGDRRRLDIGPVQVLVLGGPLGGGLLVGAAKFLLMLALRVSCKISNLRRVCQPPSSSSSQWQRGPCPIAWGTGRAP